MFASNSLRESQTCVGRATRQRRGISASQPRRRRDPSALRVAAAVSPRLVSVGSSRRGRGVAAAASPRPVSAESSRAAAASPRGGSTPARSRYPFHRRRVGLVNRHPAAAVADRRLEHRRRRVRVVDAPRPQRDAHLLRAVDGAEVRPAVRHAVARHEFGEVVRELGLFFNDVLVLLLVFERAVPAGDYFCGAGSGSAAAAARPASRNSHAAAAASSRLASTEYPRGSRGVAATRPRRAPAATSPRLPEYTRRDS